MSQEICDPARRFGGVARVYGADALLSFRDAHVAVVGIGGVGSWAVEALARSGVGRITLIDLDMIAESNVNRQVHALDGEFGKAKVSAMAERIRAINPQCTVHEIEDFVTPENLEATLGGGVEHVIDATDQVRTKAAMIAWAKRRGLPLVTAGGAGGQIDASRIQLADLACTIQDPLLARVRSLLRRDYGFPRETQKKFGVPAVFSSEPLRQPPRTGACGSPQPLSGLGCAGFGSAVCVTASFGFLAAGEVLRQLASRPVVAASPG